MNYLGEFSKNSTILLELLTKDEADQPLQVEYPPTASIEHYDENGITQVDNVTLNMIEDGRYAYPYAVPYAWDYGSYAIVYAVQIDGQTYTTKETFHISKDEDLLEDNKDLNFKILDMIDDLGGASPGSHDSSVADAESENDQYVHPPEFQIPADVIVEGNRIRLIPKEALKQNHSYMVVVGKTISSIPTTMTLNLQSASTSTSTHLEDNMLITFTSQYEPLYATPLEVRSVIRELYSKFSLHEVYVALRDAGQKVHQITGRIPDPNNSRYRRMRERDTEYFPATKFVAYEASRNLLSGFLVKMLDGNGSTGMIGNGSSIQLGDFSVDDKQGGASGDDGAKEMQLAERIVRQLEKEMKFWLDSMMGRNARGYAKPISASYRDGAGSPEGRDF